MRLPFYSVLKNTPAESPNSAPSASNTLLRSPAPVSYTHLDVYKRQEYDGSYGEAPEGAMMNWQMGPMYRTDEGWRCDGTGTGP